MPCDDIAISVRDLTKTYRIFGHPGDRIKQVITLGLRRYHREFTALRDVSFDIRKGETVGVVGRNGSGKSTLLQLICGVLKPTSGVVQVNGRVSALLELGAGFNPEFTGSENVYFQGALMGLNRRQVAERFEQIAEFADIGEFMEQPVRTYSSGMRVRLGFSVATMVRPEILIVDEALGVGDAAFQRKCYRRIHDICSQGTILLLVSHEIEGVKQICQQAYFLKEGRLLQEGPAKQVCDAYEQDLFSGQAAAQETDQGAVPDRNRDTLPGERVYGNGMAVILSCWLEDEDGGRNNLIPSGHRFWWCYRVRFHRDIARPVYGMMLKSKEGLELYGVDSRHLGQAVGPASAGMELEVRFELSNTLAPGDYFLNCGVSRLTGGSPEFLARRVDSGRLRVTRDGGLGHAVGLVEMAAAVRIEEVKSG